MSAVGRIAPASVRRLPTRRLPEPVAPATEPGPAHPRGRDAAGPGEHRAPDIAGLLPEPAVAALIDHAARMGASDLFFGFNDNHVAVSVRHLGIVRLVTILAIEHGRRCTSYIKAMAGMDLAEHAGPWTVAGCAGRKCSSSAMTTKDDEDEDDDGDEVTWPELQRRMPTVTGAGRIDLRVSTIPTLHGEDMAIRLLVGTPQVTALDQLGMSPRELNELAAMIEIPSGLILVSGPTGSGKTTTLYACLRHLNNGERKINTIEDPIEYAIPGLRQSQINPKADVGFAELLRSVLRQAPDVILIGEIRDAITAEIAVPRRQQRAPGAGVGARALGAGGRAEPAGAGRQPALPVQLAPGRDRPAAGPDALPPLQGRLRPGRHARRASRKSAPGSSPARGKPSTAPADAPSASRPGTPGAPASSKC